MAGPAANPTAAVASPATRQAAEDACVTMQAALAALKDSRDASCPAPSRAQLQAAAGQLKVEVSKVGLLFNQASLPGDAEAAALLQDFQGAAATLCMAYTGLAAAGGPTLRASLGATATGVVEACAALVRGAVGGAARDAQLMMLSGFALEMLEAAGRAPLDDRAAIGRAITQVLKQLADAQKELGEAIAEGEEAAAQAAAAGDGEDAAVAAAAAEAADDGSEGSEAGFGFEQEAFSAEQLGVARAAQALLVAVGGMVRAVVKLLLGEREGLAPEAVEGWESVLYHIKALAPVCDDLAAAVYPPQDVEELASAAEALATGCDLLREECPLPAASGGEQAGGGAAAAGAAALRAALEGVQAAQAALAQQLAAGDGDGNGGAEPDS